MHMQRSAVATVEGGNPDACPDCLHHWSRHGTYGCTASVPDRHSCRCTRRPPALEGRA